jgi:hypothetical protein
MSYNNIADMATDPHLLRRVTAAAYAEHVTDAGAWAQGAMWDLAATAGWAQAWDAALTAYADDETYLPGRDGSVITDQMILDAVQALTGGD